MRVDVDVDVDVDDHESGSFHDVPNVTSRIRNSESGGPFLLGLPLNLWVKTND